MRKLLTTVQYFWHLWGFDQHDWRLWRERLLECSFRPAGVRPWFSEAADRISLQPQFQTLVETPGKFSVSCSFELLKNGRIDNLKLRKTSGSAIKDEMALGLSAKQRLSKFLRMASCMKEVSWSRSRITGLLNSWKSGFSALKSLAHQG